MRSWKQVGRNGDWPGFRSPANGGFTLLEIVVCLSIVSLLVGVLFERLAYYQELAEKVMMDVTVTNIRSGLRMQRAALIMQEDPQREHALLTANPIGLLETAPDDYLGELEGKAAQAAQSGSWHFDRQTRDVVYRPRLTRHFKTAPGSGGEVRFRVVSRGHAVTDDGTPAGAHGLNLELITPYSWFD